MSHLEEAYREDCNSGSLLESSLLSGASYLTGKRKDQEFINPRNSTLNVREDWNSSPNLGFGKTVVDVNDGNSGIRDINSGINVNPVVKESGRAAIVNKQGYFPSNISLLGPTTIFGDC
ncbi:hypothetical protein ACOSQ3_000253 [Xanthoceras sorbifolium]